MNIAPEFPDICPHGLPVRFYETLRHYLGARRQPGSFMTAVLSNDLVEAVGHGDDVALSNLKRLVQFIYCHVPGKAWGSKTKVEAWLRGEA